MPEGRNQNRPGCLRYATARPHLRASSGHRKPPRRRLCGVGASALDRRPQENRPYNNMLRRSKIFIVTGVQIAVSSVGAAYHGQHLHANLHPYRFCYSRPAEPDLQLSTVIRYIQNQEHSSSTLGLQRRIRRVVETLQCAARSTIPFPSRQFRLDAAPRS